MSQFEPRRGPATRSRVETGEEFSKKDRRKETDLDRGETRVEEGPLEKINYVLGHL